LATQNNKNPNNLEFVILNIGCSIKSETNNQKSKLRTRGLVQVHVAVFLFGLAGLFGKLVVLPALIIVLGRVFFASVVLGGILSLKGRKAFIITKKDLLILIGFGILLAFHWFSFFRSIQLTTVALGLITYSTFPVFTALLEPILFKEKLSIKYILLALVAALGVYLAAMEGLDSNMAITGVIWGVLSGLSFAFLTTGNRKVIARVSALKISFYQDLFAFIVLLPFFFIVDFELTFEKLSLLIVLGIFLTAGAHYLFILSLDRIKARTASIISSLEPVYGIIFAIIILSEIPGILTVIGSALIILVAWYISNSKSE